MFWLCTALWLTIVGALATALHVYRSVAEFWTCRAFWACLAVFPIALIAPPLVCLLRRLLEAGL